MRDILEQVLEWRAEGRSFAIAVVTHTWGSSPRQVGSMMAVAEGGSVVGSVSGGCVEAAVIEATLAVADSDLGVVLEFSQLDPQDVWSVGLSCGGKIEVLISPILGDWDQAFKKAAQDLPFDLEIGTQGARLGAKASPGTFVYEHRRADQLVIVGGVHIAVPLIAMASELDLRTILVDPRIGFADPEQFPVQPDVVLNVWPDSALGQLTIDRRTFAVVLTHDPKIDDAALRLLICSEAGYIGALGSRTTHAQRRDRLKSEGFTCEQIDRIRGPVGLPIGATTPAEIALSILAEIVQVRQHRQS